jgi:hypothetical protein
MVPTIRWARGDRLHEWMAGLGDWGERHDLIGPHAEVFRASRTHVGAAVMGRRVFDRMGPELIELDRMRVVDAPGVTHLRFRVMK